MENLKITESYSKDALLRYVSEKRIIENIKNTNCIDLENTDNHGITMFEIYNLNSKTFEDNGFKTIENFIDKIISNVPKEERYYLEDIIFEEEMDFDIDYQFSDID